MPQFDEDQDEKVKKLISDQMDSSTGNNSTVDSEAELADKVADSHPGHTPASIDQWVQGQEKQVDQYGPEQEKAVIDNILQSRNSFGSRVANAGAGLADSLMQGVAQAGPGHFQENLANRENKTQEIAAGELPQLAGMNRQNMGEKQALEGMTSGSPLGASHAAALKPILQQLYPGKTDAEYAAMLQNPQATAANLGIPASVLESKAKLAQAQAEMEIQRGTANANRLNQEESRKLEAQRLAQEAAKAAADEKNQGEQRQHEALTELGKKSWISRVLHPGISNALEEEAGLNAPKGGGAMQVNSQEEYDALPSGARYTDSNGKAARKK